VAPVADISVPMNYDEVTMRVVEEGSGALGEVPEIDAGEAGHLTLTLEPGTYILYCNMPGHVALGMWTLLTVVP
jgi:uncharacterized cupredoxin-like copper-binding protein